MSGLPMGWKWTTLGDVCLSVTDGDHQPPPKTMHGVPFLVIGDMRSGQLSFGDTRHVPPRYYDALDPSRRPQQGDVLYSLVGSFGIAALVTESRPFCVQRHIGILRPSAAIAPRYLARVLAAKAVYRQASLSATGTAQLTVPLKALRNILIPLPPRAEQDRIVAAIEEDFSRIDAGAMALESARRKVKRMRTALLDAAVTGRLVPRDPDANAPAALLARLRHEARDRRAPNKGVPDTADLPSVPASWKVVMLADLAESIDYGTSEKARPDGEGIPILRMGNLGWGTIAYHDLKFLPPERLDNRLLLQPGDLLFNRTNSAELVGKTAVFHGYPGPISFASYLIRVRALPSADLDWASLVLNSGIGRRYVASVRSQQVGQANVNGTKLAATPIPLPSADEQARIVGECARWFSVLDALDSALATATARRERLRASILAMAFAGQLVPQDPAEESAREVIEHVVAERDASNGRAIASRRRFSTHRARIRA